VHTRAYAMVSREENEEEEEEILFRSLLHTLIDKWDLFDTARSIVSDYHFPPVTRLSRPTP